MQNDNDNQSPNDNAADQLQATPQAAPQDTSIVPPQPTPQVPPQAAPVVTPQVAPNAAEGVNNEIQNMGHAGVSKMQDLGQAGIGQVQDLGQAGIDKVQDLGKAGIDQVQNIGQAGVGKISEMVGQIANPGKDLKQPPVSKDEKVYAAIGYIPFVAIISIIIKPDSAFVRLHAKQGLLLSILFFFGGIFAAIVSLFGIIGQFLAFFIGLIPMGSLILAIYSMYLAASGLWWKLPILSSVSDLIPIEIIAKTSKENITGQMGTAKVDYDNRQETIQKEISQNQPIPQAVTTTPEVNNQAGVTPTDGPAPTTTNEPAQTEAVVSEPTQGADNSPSPKENDGPIEGQQSK